MAAVAGPSETRHGKAIDVPVIDCLEITAFSRIVEQTSCFAASGNNLVIGTKDGTLLLYSIQATKGMAVPSVSLVMKKSLGPSRQRVEKVEILPHLSQIIVLCNGKIDVLDQRSLENLSTIVIPKSTGVPAVLGSSSAAPVTTFCTGFMTPMPRGQPDLRDFRICVVCRKKLYVYKIPDFSVPVKEINLPEQPLPQVEMRAGFVYLILKKVYAELSLTTDEVTPLYQYSLRTAPCFKLLNQGIMCATDQQGKIIPYQNRATVGAQSDIEWTETPLALAFRSPFLLSLSMSALCVHSIRDFTRYQSISLTPGQQVILSDSSNHLLLFGPGGFSIILFRPVESMVSKLMAQQRVQDGLELFTALAADEPDYRRRLLDVHREAGFAWFNQMQFHKAFQAWTESSVSPADVIALFPGFLPNEVVAAGFTSETSEGTAETAAEAIPRHDIVAALHAILPETTPQETKRKHLQEAEMLLLNFLENYISSHTATTALELLDLVILKLYLELKPDKLFAFITASHPLPFEEAFTCLQRRRFFHATGRLCEASGRLRQALEIWQRIGQQPDLKDEEPRVNRSTAINSTVSLLSKTTEQELIWEFSGWVLEQEPLLGLSIFLTSARGKDDSLPPHKVLEFLTPRDKSLRLTYLEHITTVLQNTEARYHTKLAMLYLDSLIPMVTPPTTAAASSSGGGGGSETSTLTWESEAVRSLRAKLTKFLDLSNYYDFQLVLARIKELPLFEEHVIIYSKLGQHSMALRTIIERFKDPLRAEAYCQKHSKKDPDVYVELLKLYVRESQYSLSMDAATRLINNLGYKISFEQVAKLLADVPIAGILPFLSSALQHSQHAHRDGMVEHNLMRTTHMTLQSQLLRAQLQSVVITPKTECAKCKKLIGDRVFVRYPNGTILHFQCFGDDPQTDPVTGRNFVTSPVDIG